MAANTRYWVLHWLRVALWPLPVLTLFKAGRAHVATLTNQSYVYFDDKPATKKFLQNLRS